MRRAWWIALALALPQAAPAVETPPGDYGAGLVCPRTDAQVSFYTENDQQDAAGTIAYAPASGFAVTSDSVKSLKAGGAHLMEGYCEGGAPGIRIDAKRDGWLQAGTLWMPPNLEWDYADWQDFLRKAAVWKPLETLVLYQGTADEPYRDRPYPAATAPGKVEIYPLKFVDNFALVLLDRSDAFAKNCAGAPVPPAGELGWLRLSADSGGAVAVPAHPKGC